MSARVLVRSRALLVGSRQGDGVGDLEGESIRAIADAFSQLSAHTRQIADAIALPAADEQDAAANKHAG